MATVTKIPATVSRFTAAPIAVKQKRKVAAYARVSTDHEDQLNSYEAQCDCYEHYIRANDEWEYAGLCSDEGITAFAEGLLKQPLVLEQWDDQLWNLLVLKAVVSTDGTVAFTFKGENTITVRIE